MKVGRNDPCPCGSGKKYKKCCMEKDEAAGRARESEAKRAAASAGWSAEFTAALEQGSGELLAHDDRDDEVFIDFDEDDLSCDDEESDDETEEAEGAFWQTFADADQDGKIAMFFDAIAKPNALENDQAGYMLECIHWECLRTEDRETYAGLVQALRQRLPAAYDRDALLHLHNMIITAAACDRWQEVRALANEMAGIADQGLEAFNRVIVLLMYHGQLALLREAVDLAWPVVNSASDLPPRAIEKFVPLAVHCSIFDYLEQRPVPDGAEENLMMRLNRFAGLKAGWMTKVIGLITGQAQRRWTMSDFDFTADSEKAKERRGRLLDSPGWLNIHDLSLEFLGYLHDRENVPYTRAELARIALVEYLLVRQAGTLEEFQTLYHLTRKGKRRRRKAGQRPPRHVLCPDRETLAFVFQRQLLPLERYHEAAAFFELVPAWLRFLAGRGLLDTELQQRTLTELAGLQESLIDCFDDCYEYPALAAATRNWNRASLAAS